MNNFPSKVLICDRGGQPQRWATIKQAIIHLCCDDISYSDGETVAFRGGFNKSGIQTVIEVPAILWLNTSSYRKRKPPMVTRTTLFKRDHYRCAYCGHTFNEHKLSQDHIIPKSKGGSNNWLNLITSCKHCNAWKGNMTLKEAKLELRYQPRVPSFYELLYYSNHTKITPTQFNYLKQFTHGELE